MVEGIREARDSDADRLIRLVGTCWAEYPGCVLDVDGEVPELRAIASHFRDRSGRFWVVDAVGEGSEGIVGCVGASPARDTAGWELLKLYVDPRARRRGLGARLTGLVEDLAQASSGRFVELWPDTRFTAAHRLYERLGYARLAETRELHDLSDTVEYHYIKTLAR